MGSGTLCKPVSAGSGTNVLGTWTA